MNAKYDAGNPAALKRLVATGTQLRGFSRPILEAAYKAANELYGELAQKSPEFKKIYEPWVKFRDDQVLWFRICENGFDNFMAAESAMKK
jgi:TRAP-type mannitol/chloroaromatic compound transport system substrate-binding protein